MIRRITCVSKCSVFIVVIAQSFMMTDLDADEIPIYAADSGFVTEMGGSSHGDGTVVPSATYNYSVGFELHYGTGALGSPLAPMFRKNYFVFDLSSITVPITAIKLTLWTGTLESVDPGELYSLFAISDMGGALSAAAALAGSTFPGDYDSPTDPLVLTADILYDKLADTGIGLGSLGISPGMDDSFVDIIFTPAGIAHVGSFAGGMIVLSGLVPSATPPGFPQQPFGLTGPDIPGGDPKTPLLTITTVPEPSTLILTSASLFVLWLDRRKHKRLKTALNVKYTIVDLTFKG